MLRRLELMGFKSFPDRTVVDLGPGVSAIVGPNGSGKSNITDAIRWVLGEVSARALRGQRMEDVIFGGSAERRPVPLAEVTLVLDNTDGTLPVAFAEVSVTRRLDRAADGEYLINRGPCRLRDVQDLFAGTGLGRNAFAIVGQGEAEDALRARPAERRAMVEEAAGITRQRQRLEEGRRRLGAAEAAGERLRDLVRERTRAVQALAEQADRAERHREASAELRGLELGLWAREWRAAAAERDGASREAVATGAEYEALAEDLVRVAEEQREVAAELSLSRRELERQVAEAGQAERQLDQLRQQQALAQGLGDAALREAERAEARAAEWSAALADLRAEEGVGAAEAATARLAECQAAVGTAGAALAASGALRRESAQRVSSAQAEVVRSRQAQARGAADGGEALAGARREHEVVRGRVREAEAAARQAEAARVEAEAAVAPLAAELARARARTAAVRAHRDALAAAAGALDGRVRALREMAASGAGYAQGTRTVLAGRARGDPAFAGVLGALGELLEVPAELAAAIAAALGGAVADLVTVSAAAAEEAIGALRRNRGGRATFLPLDQLRHGALPPGTQGLGGAPGSLGWASRLVGCQDPVRPAVEHVLGRVLVAQDLGAARALARQSGFRIRVVSLGGEVVHPGGAMSGGAVQGERPGGLVGRDQERRQLGARLSALEADREHLNAALGRCLGEEESLARLLDGRRQQASAARARAASAAEALRAAEREAQRQERRVRELEERWRAAGEADPAELAAHVRQAEAQLAAATAEEAGCEAEEARQREALLAARLALAEAEHQVQAARERVARGEQDRRECARRIAEAEAERQRARRTVEQQQEARARAEGQAAAAQIRRAEAAEAVEVVRGRVAELERRSGEAVARREWAERERERLGQALRRAEAAQAKAGSTLAALAARLETAYGEGAEILADVEPSARPGPERERVGQLRRELAALGGVRPEAVAEYAQQRGEVAALDAGHQDLIQARSSLEEWCRELETALDERYAETLAQVRAQFSAVYARLCGGRADLVEVGGPEAPTVEGGRPVPPGLEIAAQPPGKALAHLGLLSGGERTLVAVALIFAFLRVRPAAFCVLDEIEAALDEANVARCAAFLREIAPSTQIIVVTHQKGTMEVADRLVGVTMGEPGVSRLLSLHLAG